MKPLLSLAVIFFTFSFTAFPQWSKIGDSLTGLGQYPLICVADSNIVWVAGGTGTSPKVYRTVDGGLNWVSIPTASLPYALYAIAAKDSLTAFVADGGAAPPIYGGNEKLYKTTDAGLNWTIIDSTGGTAGFYNDIQFSKSNPDFGIAMSDPANGLGEPYIVNKTTDGGVTWTKTNPPGVPNSAGVQASAYVIDPQFYGFACANYSTNKATSYTTSDGGNTWFLGDSSVTISVVDVVFNDDKQHGVMVGADWPYIKVTSNGGNNWVTVNTGININGTLASWVSGTDVVFICAQTSPSNQGIIRSDDNGLTWYQQETPIQTIVEVDNIKYGDAIYAYAVTSNGSILKSVQSVVTIVESEITPNDNYKLNQNYPNPFNPSTKIKYSVSQMSNVVIKVYDVLGNEIETLVNEEKPIGAYEITWYAESLPNGIYFYQLRAGNFVETKKMVLMK